MPAKNYNAYMAEYMLKRYHERRALAFEILGEACAHCGAGAVEIDHIDWREKSFPVSKLWSVAMKRFLAELDKCQPLCKECHAAKTKTDMREIKRERGWANQYASKINLR